jgi:hypothetical protein
LNKFKSVIGVISALLLAPVAYVLMGGIQMTQADTVSANLSVTEILDRNEAARGGLDAWRKVHTLGYTGQMRVPPPTGGPHPARAERGKLDPISIPFILAVKRPNLSRLEILYRGEPVVKIFDGTDGWMLRSMDNQWVAVPMPANMALAEAEQGSLDGPLLDAKAKGNKVTLESVDTLESGPAYRLAVTGSGGAVQHVWVDAGNFLDLKMDAVRVINGRALPVAILFADYRVSDGLMIAHRIETRALNGSPVESMSIDSVAVNPNIEVARFQKPPVSAHPAATPIKP